MSDYKISVVAKNDLRGIFLYSYKEFGLSQAENYIMQLENAIEKLSKSPEIGKQRKDLKIGLYSIPEMEHLIFYRIYTKHIKIVRILHSSRDIKNFL